MEEEQVQVQVQVQVQAQDQAQARASGLRPQASSEPPLHLLCTSACRSGAEGEQRWCGAGLVHKWTGAEMQGAEMDWSRGGVVKGRWRY